MTLLDAIVIAGANGSGKTTFARRLLPDLYPHVEFLNADEIQWERPEFAHPASSSREFLGRLAATVDDRRSFAVELTLSSRHQAAWMRSWRESGYYLTLHFIELPSADLAVQRVATRVAAGGHSVPESEVRRRFARGLDNFHAIYKPLFNEWYHYYSGEGGIRVDLIDYGEAQTAVKSKAGEDS